MLRETPRWIPTDHESAYGTCRFGSNVLIEFVMTGTIGYTGFGLPLLIGGGPRREVSRSSRGTAPSSPLVELRLASITIPGFALKRPVKSFKPGRLNERL